MYHTQTHNMYVKRVVSTIIVYNSLLLIFPDIYYIKGCNFATFINLT